MISISDEKMWSVDEIAMVMSVHPVTIRRAIEKKNLKAFYFEGQLRIRNSDLMAYIESRQATPDTRHMGRRRKPTASE